MRPTEPNTAVVLLDANVLLYAADQESPHHHRSITWLRAAFEGGRRIGLPWQTIGAFLRISTHPRLFAQPLTAAAAWSMVQRWLDAPTCWVPTAGERTAVILGELIAGLDLRGNLVPDAQLAALAIEHGVPVVSADTDFARFSGLLWINPVGPQS